MNSESVTKTSIPLTEILKEFNVISRTPPLKTLIIKVTVQHSLDARGRQLKMK